MQTRVGFTILVAGLIACSGARQTELDGRPADADATSDDVDSTEDTAEPGGTGGPSNPSEPKACSFDPSVLDVPGNGLDEDCNGKADDEASICDTSLALDSKDPFAAAAAFGLCKRAGANGWGLLDAKYVRPDGAPFTAGAQPAHGLLASFGANVPLSGSALLALSTGTARAPGQPGYQSPKGVDRGTTSERPSGLGRTTPACPGVELGAPHDGVALEVRLRVPSNAKSFAFAHQLFTYDYKEYVCSEYNDAFVVLMSPKPAGAPDGNIARDPAGNPIGVSSTVFLRACSPSTSSGLTFTCPAGVGPLSGTGFEGHASTGWLKTRAPVTPGSEITLRFAIWDSGDGLLDSTVLLDRFAFSTEPAVAATTDAN